MEAVLFQLLSIKNAFDFAFTSTFKIEIKIEIECFLIGICKFSLCRLLPFYTVCHSRFPGNFSSIYPPLTLWPLSLSISLSLSLCHYYRLFSLRVSLLLPPSLSRPLCKYLSPLGNIKWKTQPVNFVYNLSYAIISQNYLFVTSCRYIIIFYIWNRFYDCTVMKQCNKLKLQHIVVWEHTMHTHTRAFRHTLIRTHTQHNGKLAREPRDCKPRVLDCNLVVWN